MAIFCILYVHHFRLEIRFLIRQRIAAAVLIQGVGINLGRGACQTAILMTTVLYSGSKTFVYLFLGALLILYCAPRTAC